MFFVLLISVTLFYAETVLFYFYSTTERNLNYSTQYEKFFFCRMKYFLQESSLLSPPPSPPFSLSFSLCLSHSLPVSLILSLSLSLSLSFFFFLSLIRFFSTVSLIFFLSLICFSPPFFVFCIASISLSSYSHLFFIHFLLFYFSAMGWMPDKSLNPSTIYSNHLMNVNEQTIGTYSIPYILSRCIFWYATYFQYFIY